MSDPKHTSAKSARPGTSATTDPKQTSHSAADGNGTAFRTNVKTGSSRFQDNQRAMAELVGVVRNEEETLRLGGADRAINSQHKKGRLTAREHIALLVDRGIEFFELGPYAAYGMCEECGKRWISEAAEYDHSGRR